jgi:hypothetical protein
MRNLLLALVAVAWPTFVHANAKVVGNGGSTVVCRDSKEKISSVEVFDLYEGRVLRGLRYHEKAVPALEQALEMAMKVDIAMGTAELAGNFQGEVRDAFSRFVFLPSDTGLKPVDDGAEIIVPRNCAMTQTANRINENTIYVDSDIWSDMSETQRASLLLHEATYRFFDRSRVNGQPIEANSARVRKLVSYLVSGGSLEPVFGLIGDAGAVLSCRTNIDDSSKIPTTSFLAYLTQDNQLTVQFDTWLSRRVPTKTTAWSYVSQGTSWPVATDSAVVRSSLVSPVDDHVTATVRFDRDLRGEIWFSFDGQETERSSFNCFRLPN